MKRPFDPHCEVCGRWACLGYGEPPAMPRRWWCWRHGVESGLFPHLRRAA